MTDSEFLRAFDRCEIPNTEFTHVDHLRVAFLYLRADRTTAVAKITSGIRRFAAHHGASHIYHETITRAWIAILDAAIIQAPLDDFASFLIARSDICEKDSLLRFYSGDRLMSEAARAHFIEPDVAPFPPFDQAAVER